MRGLRTILGLAIWSAIVLGVWNAWSEEDAAAEPDRVADDVWSYYTGEYQPATLRLPQSVDLAVGDPIFYVAEDGVPRRIGEVHSLRTNQELVRRGYVNLAEATFYPGAPAWDEIAKAEYYSADQSLAGALAMMFPAQKRQEIVRMIVAAYQEHNEEITEELWPIVHATLKEAMLTLEQELRISFNNHRDQLRAIGARYQQEIVAEDVIPLVKEEVWPIVRRRAQPMANQIGQEVWARVSLWRFGWRMLYDKTPLLPDKNYTEKEWRRFVDAEVVPVLERHTEDFVDVTQGILRDVGKNPKVKAAFRKNLNTMLDDPEVQEILGTIVREVVIERDELRDTFKKHWTTPESRQSLRLVSKRLEPTAREIGELILGSKEQISPEFALVLRNYALAKDRRWICLFKQTADATEGTATSNTATSNQKIAQEEAGVLTLQVQIGDEMEINPFASLVDPSLESSGANRTSK